MKVLVCGSRSYVNRKQCFRFLNRIDRTYGIGEIIHGDARGADTMAGEWAEEKGLIVYKYPVDWKTYGNSAGFIRNIQMLDEGKPDLVVAFLQNSSKGTAHMIRQTQEANIRCIIYRV